MAETLSKKIPDCRFFIKSDNWNLSHEEYLEFCGNVRKVYKAVMRAKNQVMKNQWVGLDKSERKKYFIVLSDTNKFQKILLDSKRSKIYKKVGIAMYKVFDKKIPKDIRIIKEEKQKKFKRGNNEKRYTKNRNKKN